MGIRETHTTARQQPRAASQKPTIPSSITDTLKLCIKYFWCGVKDAFAWPSSLIVVYMSSTIRNRALKCFTLNGAIFLGSILFFNRVVLPMLYTLQAKPESGYQEKGLEKGEFEMEGKVKHSLFVTAMLGLFVKSAYQLFWIYPVFLLSFILNAIWYQQIADKAYSLCYGQPVVRKMSYFRIPRIIADEVYRALLVMNYVAIAILVYGIPLIGPVVSFIFFCWIYAFYSFEYKWTAEGWNLEQRINYFEERWAYFAGFGMQVLLLMRV
ncbi:5279_t:CDS:2 [Paraglomus brasilianum]|uniref:5279_t:CDS:1 n=1 Tax=Paraglomus brasilianum TaxID=144538 RepID=A0A9N8WH29_9GLOM|nr:5279_t:CDS:2 [Paraglomus brasilianum]